MKREVCRLDFAFAHQVDRHNSVQNTPDRVTSRRHIQADLSR